MYMYKTDFSKQIWLNLIWIDTKRGRCIQCYSTYLYGFKDSAVIKYSKTLISHLDQVK